MNRVDWFCWPSYLKGFTVPNFFLYKITNIRHMAIICGMELCLRRLILGADLSTSALLPVTQPELTSL